MKTRQNMRATLGLTLAEVTSYLSISTSAVAKAEKGKRKIPEEAWPKYSELNRIAGEILTREALEKNKAVTEMPVRSPKEMASLKKIRAELQYQRTRCERQLARTSEKVDSLHTRRKRMAAVDKALAHEKRANRSSWSEDILDNIDKELRKKDEMGLLKLQLQLVGLEAQIAAVSEMLEAK